MCFNKRIVVSKRLKENKVTPGKIFKTFFVLNWSTDIFLSSYFTLCTGTYPGALINVKKESTPIKTTTNYQHIQPVPDRVSGHQAQQQIAVAVAPQHTLTGLEVLTFTSVFFVLYLRGLLNFNVFVMYRVLIYMNNLFFLAWT